MQLVLGRHAHEENIHADSLLYMISSLGIDPHECEAMFAGIPTIAAKNAWVTRASRELRRDLDMADPEARDELLWTSFLRRANDVVSDLVFSDVPGRVAKALLDLADRFGRTAEDGIHVHHDLTQEELAQLVGASRETVNKALADFASRGWLRLEPRSVVLMDPERLARRAR